ncbi:MAG: glycosyltransferase family 39 protein [Deltaproteobacteria bacterium]|nr:glycosyltransferase family 39 protein [Deltaproteobacteria bacterium]
MTSRRSSPFTPVAMSDTPLFLQHRRWSVFLLVSLCGVLYLYGLGTRDFETTDEARRALVVRGMVDRGNYAVPEISGHPYLQKPPLYYWLAAIVQKASGSTDEWVYRLPSALAATGSVVLLFLIADRLLSRRAALVSSAMLATCALFIVYGARAGIDMTLCFLVTLSMLCLLQAREADWRGTMAWGFWGATGLAFLAKGPIGLFFPLAAATALAAGPGFVAEIRKMRPLLGLLVALALVLPWAALILDQIGAEAMISLMREEVFGGFRGGPSRHPQPLLFYLYETPVLFLPWAFLLPAGVLALREKKSDGERKALLLAAAWLLPALIVFSLSHQKREYYLLPSFGALALWIGWTADRFLLSPATGDERGVARRLTRLGFLALTAVAAAGALAGGAYLRSRHPDLSDAVGIALAAVALWALFALISLRRGRPGRAIAAVVICAVLYVGTARGALAGWLNEKYSPRHAALQIAREVPPEAELLSLFRSELFIEAYVGRPVLRIDNDRELRRRLAAGKNVYVLINSALYPARRHLFRQVVIPSIVLPGKSNVIMLASN